MDLILKVLVAFVNFFASIGCCIIFLYNTAAIVKQYKDHLFAIKRYKEPMAPVQPPTLVLCSRIPLKTAALLNEVTMKEYVSNSHDTDAHTVWHNIECSKCSWTKTDFLMIG